MKILLLLLLTFCGWISIGADFSPPYVRDKYNPPFEKRSVEEGSEESSESCRSACVEQGYDEEFCKVKVCPGSPDKRSVEEHPIPWKIRHHYKCFEICTSGEYRQYKGLSEDACTGICSTEKPSAEKNAQYKKFIENLEKVENQKNSKNCNYHCEELKKTTNHNEAPTDCRRYCQLTTMNEDERRRWNYIASIEERDEECMTDCLINVIGYFGGNFKECARECPRRQSDLYSDGYGKALEKNRPLQKYKKFRKSIEYELTKMHMKCNHECDDTVWDARNNCESTCEDKRVYEDYRRRWNYFSSEEECDENWLTYCFIDERNQLMEFFSIGYFEECALKCEYKRSGLNTTTDRYAEAVEKKIQEDAKFAESHKYLKEIIGNGTISQ